MASKKQDPRDAFESLVDALYADHDSRDDGRSFDDDIVDLEYAFNRVMDRVP